jgi:hypothetical protein
MRRHPSGNTDGENPMEVPLDHWCMGPFIWSEFHSGVYNTKIKSQPARKNVWPNWNVRGENNTVNKFTGDIAAERHQCHSISTILKGFVDGCYVISQPTRAHSDAEDGENPRILMVHGSRFGGLWLRHLPILVYWKIVEAAAQRQLYNGISGNRRNAAC